MSYPTWVLKQNSRPLENHLVLVNHGAISLALHLTFGDRVSHQMWSSPIWLNCWSVSVRDLPFPHPYLPQCWYHRHTHLLLLGCGGLNSGPYAYMTGTLLTELSPVPESVSKSSSTYIMLRLDIGWCLVLSHHLSVQASTAAPITHLVLSLVSHIG